LDFIWRFFVTNFFPLHISHGRKVPPPPQLAAKVPRRAETSRLRKLEIVALRALSEEDEDEEEDEVPRQA
jgi:hypothetical protein